MASENFGLKIGLEGEKEFKSQLTSINQAFKVLGSEMKLVDSEFAKNDQSVQALTARNEVLEKSIDTQKQKIEVLRSALANAASSFGETDKRTQAWQIQLNNAQAELNGMEKELKENQSALKSTSSGMNDAEKSADKMGDEIEDAGNQADKSSSKMEALGGVCKGVAAALTAAFAAVSAAAIAAGKALVDMTREGAAYADTVLTESTVTGISTEKLQEYMYAAELVDVSVETLTKSMAKNIKSMKSAADGSKAYAEAYEQLGVSVVDAEGNLRDSDEVYWELIEALGQIENETERDAIAMQVLGKSAQELNPLIVAGAERMAELGEEARKAGYVLSDDTLNAYGAYDDQLQKLTTGATAAKNALGTVLLPILTELSGAGVDLLGDFTRGIQECGGDISKMADVISDILPKALDTVMKYVPQILDLIVSVVGSIGKAIVDNLPMIVSAVSQIIFTILNGLIAALPQIADGALQLVLALVDGITMAQIAQEEYEEKSEAIKWTFKKRFEQGQLIVNPNTPLGYKFNEDGHLVVVPGEAKIVKRIYESYAKGIGSTEIARRLNKDGYRTAHGRQYLPSTILYIIKNEKYKGDAMLQKYVVADGKKIKNMGEAQQYYVENDHEAIVSRELWDTCQRLIERHKTSEYVRAENREFDPFKGKIVCGKCGHNYKRIKRSDKKTRYGCYLKSSKGMNACRSESIKLETLERVFVETFNLIHGKRKSLMEMQVTDEVRELNNEITRMLNQERTYLQLQARDLLHGEIEEEYRKLLNRIVRAEEQKKVMLETNGQNVKAQNDLRVYNSAVMRTAKLTEFDEKVFEQIVRQIVVVDREHFAFHLTSGEVANVSIIYWATSEDEIQSIDIKAVTEVC